MINEFEKSEIFRNNLSINMIVNSKYLIFTPKYFQKISDQLIIFILIKQTPDKMLFFEIKINITQYLNNPMIYNLKNITAQM